jgi:hypothetical protein
MPAAWLAALAKTTDESVASLVARQGTFALSPTDTSATLRRCCRWTLLGTCGRSTSPVTRASRLFGPVAIPSALDPGPAQRMTLLENDVRDDGAVDVSADWDEVGDPSDPLDEGTDLGPPSKTDLARRWSADQAQCSAGSGGQGRRTVGMNTLRNSSRSGASTTATEGQ